MLGGAARNLANMVYNERLSCACGRNSATYFPVAVLEEDDNMIKPTFTDVNGVKIKCSMTTDSDKPHLLVSRMEDDGSLTPILEMNVYDSKYMANACEIYLKQAASANLQGSMAGLSPDEMAEQFGYEGDPTNH